MTTPHNGLTGLAFIEDLVDTLHHLEDGFAACLQQTGKQAATVDGFRFTQPQISTLINVLEAVLAVRRSISGLDDRG